MSRFGVQLINTNLFEESEEAVRDIIQSASVIQLRNNFDMNTSVVSDARARLIDRIQGGGNVSGDQVAYNSVNDGYDFDVGGSVHLNEDGFRAQSDFNVTGTGFGIGAGIQLDDDSFRAQSNFNVTGTGFGIDGGIQYSDMGLLAQSNFRNNSTDDLRFSEFGFNVYTDEDGELTSVSASYSRVWETNLGPLSNGGFSLGFYGGQNQINEQGFEGTEQDLNVVPQFYVVKALRPNLFVDGYISLGIGRRVLSMTDGTLQLDAEYETRSMTTGIQLTGTQGGQRYLFMPSVGLQLGVNSIGDIQFRGETDGAVDENLHLTVGTVMMSSASLGYDFQFSIDDRKLSDSRAILTLGQSYASDVMLLDIEPTIDSSIENRLGFRNAFSADRGMLEIYLSQRAHQSGEVRQSAGVTIGMGF